MVTGQSGQSGQCVMLYVEEVSVPGIETAPLHLQRMEDETVTA